MSIRPLAGMFCSCPSYHQPALFYLLPLWMHSTMALPYSRQAAHIRSQPSHCPPGAIEVFLIATSSRLSEVFIGRGVRSLFRTEFVRNAAGTENAMNIELPPRQSLDSLTNGFCRLIKATISRNTRKLFSYTTSNDGAKNRSRRITN